MKITKQNLRKVIKKTINEAFSENDIDDGKLAMIADSDWFWKFGPDMVDKAWDREELIDWAMQTFRLNQAPADAAIGMLID